MKKLHSRRKRRQTKMVARSHGKFKVGHKRKGGRTGSSKPGRMFRDHGVYAAEGAMGMGTPAKKVRPRAFIFGEWCLCDKVVDAIVEQERLESLCRTRDGFAPETSLDERRAMARVIHGCKEERDRAYRSCSGHERFVFDAWRRTSPGLREAIKAVLVDRDIGRKDPRRKALAARPLGPGAALPGGPGLPAY